MERNYVYLTDCSEDQPNQQTSNYESTNTPRADAAVYSHISPSTEPSYENSDVRPKDTSNVEHEDIDAETEV